MEALTNMMSIIDLNSELIPEGDYLKLCNFMRDIHKTLPREPTERVPFQPIPIPEDLRDRRRILNAELGRIMDELRRIRNRMKALKIRQRVTEGVKRDAIRDAANRMGFAIRSLTLDSLRDKGVVIPHAHMFYKEYMERTNAANQVLLDSLMMCHDDMRREEDRIRSEWRDVQQVIDEWVATH
jgi:hypothetical protein